MEKNKNKILKHFIIGSAIIWAAIILGCALILKETFSQISLLLNGAATIHLIIMWGLQTTQLKKQTGECKLK